MHVNPNKPPFLSKLSWGAGGLANDLVNTIGALSIPIYAIALGINPAWVGLAMAIPRLWDAFADPLMGHITDNFRSRFGRRKPFVVIGALLMGITFPLIWLPSADWSHSIQIGFYIVASLLFYTSFTIWNIPWNAMGLEMTSDVNQRTSVQAYRSAIATLAGWIVPWAYKLSFMLGETELEGVRKVGLIIGAIMFISGILSAFYCKEATEATSQPKISLKKAFAYTLKNRSFLLICACVTLFITGIFLVIPMTLYVNIYYVFGGDKEAASTLAGLSGMLGSICALCSVPLIAAAAARIGKRKTLMTGLSIIAIGKVFQWFFFTPAMPYLQLVPGLIVPCGIAFVWIIIPSMVADICDEEDLATGLRREGMYTAVYAWLIKVGVTLGTALSGLFLTFAGIETNLATQSDASLLNLRITFCAVPAIFSIFAIICIKQYKLDESTVLTIQRKLKAREENQD
ncbi:MFS transporter [Coraliomargarita sp. W4R72]